MPECSGCGGYVTRDFIRVFGMDGTVNGCPNCMKYGDLSDGEAVGR